MIYNLLKKEIENNYSNLFIFPKKINPWITILEYFNEEDIINSTIFILNEDFTYFNKIINFFMSKYKNNINFIDSSCNKKEKLKIYKEGGIIFISFTILFMDLLLGKISPHLIKFIVVNNAEIFFKEHLITIIINICLKKNKYIRIIAYTDKISLIYHNKAKINILLKNLFINKIKLLNFDNNNFYNIYNLFSNDFIWDEYCIPNSIYNEELSLKIFKILDLYKKFLNYNSKIKISFDEILLNNKKFLRKFYNNFDFAEKKILSKKFIQLKFFKNFTLLDSFNNIRNLFNFQKIFYDSNEFSFVNICQKEEMKIFQEISDFLINDAIEFIEDDSINNDIRNILLINNIHTDFLDKVYFNKKIKFKFKTSPKILKLIKLLNGHENNTIIFTDEYTKFLEIKLFIRLEYYDLKEVYYLILLITLLKNNLIYKNKFYILKNFKKFDNDILNKIILIDLVITLFDIIFTENNIFNFFYNFEENDNIDLGEDDNDNQKESSNKAYFKDLIIKNEHLELLNKFMIIEVDNKIKNDVIINYFNSINDLNNVFRDDNIIIINDNKKIIIEFDQDNLKLIEKVCENDIYNIIFFDNFHFNIRLFLLFNFYFNLDKINEIICIYIDNSIEKFIISNQLKNEFKYYEELNEYLNNKNFQISLNNNIENNGSIVFDKRELKATLIIEWYNKNIFLYPSFLSKGDYIIGENIGIERKNLENGDFYSSILDNRLNTQLKNLTKKYEKPILLIEYEKVENFRKIEYVFKNNHNNKFFSFNFYLFTLQLKFPNLFIILSPSNKFTTQLILLIKQISKEPDLTNFRLEGGELK